jgi:hypothetical protein
MVSIIKPVYFQAKPAQSNSHSSHSNRILIKYAEEKAHENMKDYSRADLSQGADPLREDKEAKLILAGFRLKREKLEAELVEKWRQAKKGSESGQQKTKGINIKA